MSDTTSTTRPPHDERRAQVTDESRAFKKSTQTIDGNEVTTHDINDEYMKDPPRNVPEAASAGGTVPGMKAPKNSEFYSDDIPDGAMGENILGREKLADVQSSLIDQSETTSRA